MSFFGLSEVQRQKMEKERETHRSFENKELRVRVVTTSDRDTDEVLLLKTKCLFQKQLSKMPREYILRQVFDSKHMNMVLVNKGDDVVGGVCYRPFFEEGFVEIVFLAVDYDFQVRGMGSVMMDIFKENIKREMVEYSGMAVDRVLGAVAYRNKEFDGLDHFLSMAGDGVQRPLYIVTYADNFAIGYFRKQGFSSDLRFSRWIGLIKDYEGGTIVECRVFWEINYLRRREFIGRIRERVFRDMERVNEYHVVRRIADYSTVKEIGDIPGVRSVSPQPQCRGSLNKLISYLISDLRSNPSAWPFLKPVDAAEVPDYYEHIKRPMDLSTMQSKLEDNRYPSIEPFVEDVRLMVDNCFRYNGRDTQYYKCAQKLLDNFNSKLEFYIHAINRFSS